jgi:hypothetical protein
VFSVSYFTLVRSAVCQRCPIWLFSVGPWFRAFPVCYSGIVWMIFRRFHFPLLFLMVLLLHSTRAVFLRLLYFRIFSACFQITFLSLEITASINMRIRFPLSRIVMSDLLLGWYCRFALVDSIIWLLYLRDLCLLISVCGHTSVCFLILCLFSCIW